MSISMLSEDFAPFVKLQPSGGTSTQASDPLAALNVAMAEAGLGSGSEVTPQWSFGGLISAGKKAASAGKAAYGMGKALGLFSDGPEAEVEAQFLDTFLRSQVEDLIKKLNEYVNRYGNLVECVPLVTKCVQQFGAGQYASALATGYQAFNCISSKI